MLKIHFETVKWRVLDYQRLQIHVMQMYSLELFFQFHIFILYLYGKLNGKCLFINIYCAYK